MAETTNQRELFDAGERSVLPQADRVTSGRTCTPAAIGTGPKGETCGSCRHIIKVGNAKKVFKCGLVKKYWTHGEATDIKARWPSCNKWETLTGANQ